MQFSKLKSKLVGFLCDQLKGRIQINATVNRKFSDSPKRVWITIDKREILSASDVSYAIKHEKLYQQIKVENNLKGIPYNPDWMEMFNSEERQGLVKASDAAKEMLTKESIFESYDLYSPLIDYSNLSIEEAMNSENVIIRAFSMFDRRLGKRRLNELKFSQETHPLIMQFYNIRCGVEGINHGHSFGQD